MADAGFKLAVEGEREFKKAIQEINAQIKANQAELKLLAEQYRNSDDSMGRLTAAQKSLEEAMDLQGQKVATLREQYEKAAETYGENDIRVVKLKTTLTEATAEYTKLTNEVNVNQKAIDANWRSMAGYEEVSIGVKDALSKLDEVMIESRKEIDELADEYKSLVNESKDVTTSQENLISQNKLISESVDEQRKKINILREEMKVMTKLYGENSEEAEKYRKEIKEATDELSQMEKQIKKNEDEMSDSGKSAQGLLDALDVVSELTGVKIPSGIKDIIKGLDSSSIAAGGIAVALAGVAAQIGEIFKDLIGWADELTKKSQEMNVDTEQYQALEYAATKLGVSMDTIDDAIKEVNNKVGESHEVLGKYIGDMDALKDATDAEKEAVAEQMAVWDELGVVIYDETGTLRDAKDILYDLIDAYGKMPAGIERSKAMTEMFGEEARRLNPLIEAGTTQLKNFEDEARRAGIVMEEETIEALDKTAMKFEEFELRASAALRNVASNVIDRGWFGQSAIGGFAGLFEDLGEIIKNIFGGKSYATGTYNHIGGYALVGEKGPEIVSLPQGSRVYPHGTSPEVGSSVNNYNITISAASIREFNDVVRIVQGAQQTLRMR